MRTYQKYVGIDNNNFFSLPGDSNTFLNCMNYLQQNDTSDYLGFRATNNTGSYTDSGICVGLKRGIKVDTLKASDTDYNNVELYEVPQSNSCKPISTSNVDNCMSNPPSKKIKQDISDVKNQLAQVQNKLNVLNVSLYALQNNITTDQASNQYNQTQLTNQLQLQKQLLESQIDLYTKQLLAFQMASDNANAQLSDKNRLLSTANADIQKKYSKISDVSAEINTITQQIYDNQIQIERKDQVLKSMKVIILILVILLVIIASFYFSKKSPSDVPAFFQNITSNFRFS